MPFHYLPLSKNQKQHQNGNDLKKSELVISLQKVGKLNIKLIISTKFNFSFTKMNSVDSSVQCQGDYGLNDIGLPEDVEIKQIHYRTTSCSSTSTHPNYEAIVEDDYDTSVSSSVNTCCESNCQDYTCCEIESCDEKVFAVTKCPKEANGGSKDINDGPEIEYKGKDLTNYLGMLDCVSSSIAEYKVCEFCYN